MKKIRLLIGILIILLWVFFYVIGYSTGWHRGFDKCSQIWDKQIENHNLILVKE